MLEMQKFNEFYKDADDKKNKDNFRNFLHLFKIAKSGTRLKMLSLIQAGLKITKNVSFEF